MFKRIRIRRRSKNVRRWIADCEMRRGLFEFLWQFHPDAKVKVPSPCPFLTDEQIEAELKRILRL